MLKDMKKKFTEQIHDFWFNIPEKLRFIFVGGFNSLVSFIMFVCILHFFAQFCLDDTLKLYNWAKSTFPVLKFVSLHQFVRQLSLALAWFLSSFVSFSTQRLMVFRARGYSNIFKQYVRCLSTWFIGYVVNAIVLEIFATCFEKTNLLPPVIETDIAQAFALVLSAITTYFLFKYFAFTKKKSGVTDEEDEFIEII